LTPFSPDGQFLFAAGQGDSQLAAYRINNKSGKLTQINQYPTGANPIWVEAVQLP
jgi:6-phosphogluconolactonase